MAGLSSYQIASQVPSREAILKRVYIGQIGKSLWWRTGRIPIGCRHHHGTRLMVLQKSKNGNGNRSKSSAPIRWGTEKFSSSPLSRSIVRAAVDTNRVLRNYTPIKHKKSHQQSHDAFERRDEFRIVRFNKRASVNLTIAALLISLGTSLKLPLSTTYVSFMVAMGTSVGRQGLGERKCRFTASMAF